MANTYDNKYVEVDGLKPFMQLLQKIRMDDKESEAVRLARLAISKAMKKAREEGVGMIGRMIPNNQRHAEKALRAKAYSKKSGVLGGNISALRRKHRNGDKTSSRPIPLKRNGKEREWSPRTKEMWGYQGENAQFLLYWLSQGTSERKAGLGRANKRGVYGTESTSLTRRKYFGGTHNVGKIDANTINPNLYALLERVVNNEIIPNIDDIWQKLAKG